MIDIRLYTLLEVVKFNSSTGLNSSYKTIREELDIKIFYLVDKEIKPTKEGNIVIQYTVEISSYMKRMKQCILVIQRTTITIISDSYK